MSQHSPTDAKPGGPDAEEPVVLVGAPKSLRGELRVDNPGDEKVVLREALVRASPAVGGASGAQAALKAAPPPARTTRVALSANIPPRQSQRVPLSFDLGRHTEPGEYHGELQVGESTRPLVIHVAESVRLRVTPEQLVIDGGSGATVRKRVVLSNEGNVTLTVGEIGRVALGEELALSYGFRTAIASSGRDTQALEELFAEIVRDETRTLLRRVGWLEVSNRAAPVVLQPGEVRPLDLEIRLPDNLEANTRYRGRLPLYTADLEFVVVPPAQKSARPPRKPAPDSLNS